MGKNYMLIQQAKELQRHRNQQEQQKQQLRENIENITPQVYACIALALHRRYGWGHKRINDLFRESQIIWEDCVFDERNMIQICADETGIECVRFICGGDEDE